MKVAAPALLPILRSDALGEILARLYLTPERSWTLTALTQATGVPLPTLTREATRMVAAGLLLEERVGRSRVLRPNRSARTYEPLKQLLALTYGPVPVLQQELRDVAGISAAFVYGSWAARHEGIDGPEPNDVDVIAVGTPDPDDVFDVAERARRRLHREVNIRTLRPEAWDDPEPSDPFLQHVRSAPLVALDLAEPTNSGAEA